MHAQALVSRSSEIVKIGNAEYYMHHVEAGQTLYSISKTYNVSIDEITRLNPEVTDGLKAEMVIGIPVVEESEVVEQQLNDVEHPQVAPIRPSTSHENAEPVSDGTYVVQSGEDLYDIAKKFGIDVSEFKAVNPGLGNYPIAGTTIMVPAIYNEDDYIVHKVEEQERTSSLVKRWKVSEDDFQEKNMSVGSRVFVGQIVLIPIDPVVRELPAVIPDEPEVVEGIQPVLEEPQPIVEEPEPVVECDINPENAHNRYHVALLVPLYLHEAASINVSKETIAQAQKSRALSFLQFYEGFMLAVDSLVACRGLKLDLTVIDVTDSESTAHRAVENMEGSDFDLIIGPFFGKSFSVVSEYAKENDILIVNPLSTRESILDDYPNVVKLKPNRYGQIRDVATLVKNQYKDANVFVVSQEKAADSLFLDELERQLNLSINEDVVIENADILKYAEEESERQEMGEQMVSTITVEGQVYSTNELKNVSDGKVLVENQIGRYPYSELGKMISKFSGVRTNFVVAYGESNVFATQVLNGMKKSSKGHPITLVALPEWNEFEKLSVETLLQMNAIYVDDGFVDYSDNIVKQFVLQFRRKYGVEAMNYAFEGFDVAWYFFNALMLYGSDMRDCLPSCDIPLLRSSYHFVSSGANRGLENQSWRMYQHDSELIELKPVDSSQQIETEK